MGLRETLRVPLPLILVRLPPPCPARSSYTSEHQAVDLEDLLRRTKRLVTSKGNQFDDTIFDLARYLAATAAGSASSSKILAIRPVHVSSAAGGTNSTIRWAASTKARAAAWPGWLTTTGRPVSPPAPTAGSRGMFAIRGMPSESASSRPPPDPKSSWRCFGGGRGFSQTLARVPT